MTYRIFTGCQARQTAYHADPAGWREMAGTVHERALALSFDASQAESDDTTMFKLRMVGMTPLCFVMRGRLFVH